MTRLIWIAWIVLLLACIFTVFRCAGPSASKEYLYEPAWYSSDAGLPPCPVHDKPTGWQCAP